MVERYSLVVKETVVKSGFLVYLDPLKAMQHFQDFLVELEHVSSSKEFIQLFEKYTVDFIEKGGF